MQDPRGQDDDDLLASFRLAPHAISMHNGISADVRERNLDTAGTAGLRWVS